uniref:Uncharacterized protein n=1 Tax=Anguilla anguilla TaxID=7936 RepID=A0A0E9PQS9_ANGAN
MHDTATAIMSTCSVVVPTSVLGCFHVLFSYLK